jgi:hypothetical protein
VAGTALRSSLRALVVSLTVAALTMGGLSIASYLIFPVTGLQVEGARMFPEMDAWQAMPEHASLLTLNPKSVERDVESNPWVETARVTVDRTSGIVSVEVEERRAVLDADVDGRRVILAADGTELPGPGGMRLRRVEVEGSRLEEIVRAGKAFERGGMRLESIDRVDTGGVWATVDGRRVIFSEEPSLKQVEALRGVMREHHRSAVFDLRSPGRVVVGDGA